MSYWNDVMNHSVDTDWLVFVNAAPGVDPDPFKKPNVRVQPGLMWHSMIQSSVNLKRSVDQFQPSVLLFNGTLALIKLLPAILFLRFSSIILKRPYSLRCVFHNGAIYESWQKNLINRVAVSVCAWIMNQNIFVSQFVSRYWWCFGMVLSRPFIPCPRQPPGHKGSDNGFPVVGFLGRLSQEKDPELFLESMKIVRQSLSCRVVVAGSGVLGPTLSKQYPWAEFQGWVVPHEWFKEVNLLVTTSKTEGWPYAIGEALEAGVPVVGVNVGGVGEVLGMQRSQWLCTSRQPNDVSSLVAKSLLNYDNFYQEYFSFSNEPIKSLTPQEWAKEVHCGSES